MDLKLPLKIFAAFFVKRSDLFPLFAYIITKKITILYINLSTVKTHMYLYNIIWQNTNIWLCTQVQNDDSTAIFRTSDKTHATYMCVILYVYII